MKLHSLTSASAIAMSLVCGAAIAQEPQPTETETRTLNTVVVTAQLRKESAQDVPISLTAVDGASLEQDNITSLQDLSGKLPSVVVSQSVSYGLAPIAIRGIGGPAGGGSLLTDQPVAVYVDGVYVRALGQSVSDFLDLDTLQVLRGPQGTLYGRNSTAGAIILTSQRPDFDFGGNARISYDSLDTLKLAGAVNIPLVEDVMAMRAAISHNSGGDWADNTVDDREFGGSESTSGRLSLRYTPTTDLTFDLIGEVSRGEDSPATLQLATVELGQPIPTLPLQLYQGDPNLRRTDYNSIRDASDVQIIGRQLTETEAENITFQAEWDVSDSLKLTSISGYRHFNVNGIQDTSPWINGALPGETGSEFWNNLGGVIPGNISNDSRQNGASGNLFTLGWNQTDQDYTTFSQELRLAGDHGALRWTLGGYYATEETDASIRIVNEQGGPPMFVTTPAPGVVPGSGSGLDLNFVTTQDTTVYAAFADVTYDVTDTVSLTGGLRYSRDEKEADITNTVQTLRTSVVPPLNAGTVTSCPGATNDCDESFEKVTPRLVANYKPTGNNLFYVSYSEGFTSGGFNNFGDITGALADRPLEVESETITNYEIGSKNDLFDNALRFNISGFLTTYKNLQIRQAVNTGGVAIVNVPEAEIKGIELETLWNVTDDFSLSFNSSWLDAEITEGTLFGVSPNLGVVAVGTNQTPVAIDVSGANLTRAPEWIGNLTADYRHQTDFGHVNATASYKFQSETYFSETNQSSDLFKGEAWEELDLRLMFSPESEIWTLSLFATNVFDDRHVTQIVPYFNMPTATLNRPQTVGAAFTYDF